MPFVSDFFDFSIYIDADEADDPALVRRALPQPARDRLPGPEILFPPLRRRSSDAEAERIADGLWTRINLVNLRENILPTRPRADLILSKGANHRDRTGGAAPHLSPQIRRLPLDFCAAST